MHGTCIKICAVLFRTDTWPDMKHLLVASARGSLPQTRLYG